MKIFYTILMVLAVFFNTQVHGVRRAGASQVDYTIIGLSAISGLATSIAMPLYSKGNYKIVQGSITALAPFLVLGLIKIKTIKRYNFN